MAANPEWHYSKNDTQFGPISSAELKQLAASGGLSPSDLIWKEGMVEWKVAGTVKGLFAEQSITIAPPPLPQNTENEQAATGSSVTSNVADTLKSDFNVLMNTAKQAKDLAVAHTKKTQIIQMTLPSLYLALGKDVFVGERFREEFSDLFERIASTNNQIAKLKASSKEVPNVTDLKGKVQAGAAQLMAQGQATKLKIQRDSLVRELGTKAFESHGTSAGSPELVSPISSAIEEIERLDLVIKPSNVGEERVNRNPLRRLSKTAWILGGVAMLGLTCCGLPTIFLGLMGIGIEHHRAEEEKEVLKEKPIEVDSTTLVANYRENTVSANKKYKDKVLRVTGVVKKIEERWIELESVHGFVGKNFDLLRVHIYLSDKEKTKMASLRQGQRIAVKGKCSGKGFGDSINIEKAVLIE